MIILGSGTKYYHAFDFAILKKEKNPILCYYQCGVKGMKNTLLMRTMPPIIPIAHTFVFNRFFMSIPYLL